MGRSRRPPLSGDGDALEDAQLVQNHARAAGDAGERVLGHANAEPGLLVQELVQSPQERAAMMMSVTGSRSASRISSAVITTVLGRPSSRSRPWTSMGSWSSPSG